MNKRAFDIKGISKYFIQILLALIICIVIGELLMLLIYRFPLNAEHIESAEPILYEQNTSADYPLIHAWAQYFKSYRPGVFDGGSVKIIVETCFKDVNSDYLRESLTPEYSRYWHGYVVLWRPLLYVLEYNDLEIALTLLIFFLAMMIATEIRRKKSLVYVCYFWAYFCLTMPMIVGMCLQYVPLALIINLGLLYYLKHTERLSDESNAFYIFFLIVGAITNYSDLLTYPLCTWGIIIIWSVVLDPVARKPLYYVNRVILSGISWIIGYGGMWVGKALLNLWFLDAHGAMDIFYEAAYRTGDSEPLWNRFNAMYLNWRHYMTPVYGIILGICVFSWVWSTLLKGWRNSDKRYALGLIMFSSPLWYFILSNHTRIHHLFTYRIYGVMIMAALALMAESKPSVKSVLRKSLIRMLIVFILCCVPALAFTMVTYEETEISNKAMAYPECRTYYTDTLNLEMEFIPAQKRVTGLAISVFSESTEGYFLLHLMDGSVQLYEERFDIHPEGYFEPHPVDWTLEKGHSYKLILESIENDMPVEYRQFDGDITLNEIGPGTVNGVQTGNESLFSVFYWFRPYSIPRKIYIFVTWYIISLLACYIFSDLAERKDMCFTN